jgi:ribose/xylose/arabinose/galactoside ABC-type transport system permease subunit
MLLLRRLRFYYPWVFLAIIVLAFSLTSGPFPTGNNWIVIIRGVSVTGLYALANTFVFLGAGVDVSVISIGASTGVVYGKLFHVDGISTHAAFILAIMYAIGLGLINGVLVAKARIAPFIATLATASVFNSITEQISGNRVIFHLGEQADPPDHFFLTIGRGTVGAVPVQIFIFLGLALTSFLLLGYTVYGRHLYAAGANPRAARLTGVNVDRILISTYVVCGFLSGVAGLIRTSDNAMALRVGATIFTTGPGLLDSIGAVLIGGTALSGGIGTIQGTVGGSMILGVLSNALFLFAAPNWAKLMTNGAVVIGAVTIGVLLSSGAPFQLASLRESLSTLPERLSVLWRRPVQP